MIHLTQTGCQFVEPEGKNLGFETLSFDDCKQINNQTGEKRLGEVQPMILEPGKYIFRVQNKNVPYELGFWLRGSGIGRLTLPSVSGGGLTEGSSKDYLIELTEGEYVYSCPLNPTPDYPMIIKRK
ncbi:hypothetical protein [Hahella ganghwensis]|uniref:hypothetical protein n=1 Tax=Hahella ganghwensis TaxID=286420 RepID=UPI0003A9DB6F|nr:hypothetical protein [Hahella ganghwensis]